MYNKKMKKWKTKSILLLVLISIVCLPLFLTACGGKKLPTVSVSKLAKEEFGSALPQILFVDGDYVVFWGEIGLFKLDTRDASIYRSVDLSKINSNQREGCNHMAGETITKFWYSADKESIYVINTGVDIYNGPKGPEPHEIRLEEMELTENVSGELDILPPPKPRSFDLLPKQPPGYTSNIILEKGKAYYLFAEDWYVKELRLGIYDTETGEETVLTPFS